MNNTDCDDTLSLLLREVDICITNTSDEEYLHFRSCRTNLLVSKTVEDKIKEIQRRQQTAENSENSTPADMEQLEAAKQKILSEMTSLEGMLKQKASEISMMEGEVKHIKEIRKQELPKKREKVQLMDYITNIRWQYDALPEEIKGAATNESKSLSSTFSLKSSEHSKYFISNYLWEKISELNSQ